MSAITFVMTKSWYRSTLTDSIKHYRTHRRNKKIFKLFSCSCLFLTKKNSFFQAEIIATCRDNVHCLQTVLRGLPGDVLSNLRGQEIRGKFVVVVENECRCAPIARFLATVIDFTMDWTNIYRNWPLYKYFIDMIKSFYRLVQDFAKKVKVYRNANCKLLP